MINRIANFFISNFVLIPILILIAAFKEPSEIERELNMVNHPKAHQVQHPAFVWFLIISSRIVRWTIIGTIIIATTKFIVEVMNK